MLPLYLYCNWAFIRPKLASRCAEKRSHPDTYWQWLTSPPSDIAPIAFGLIATAFAIVSWAAPPAERQLAPGVLTTISPSLVPDDTVSTHDLLEVRSNSAIEWKPEFLAASDTLYGMADKAKFRRDIYCLEFAFKPLRLIEVDVPLASGATTRKLVWYLVYRIRNTGEILKPVQGDDGVYGVQTAKGGPVRFVPQFVLERKIANRPVRAYRRRISIA